jgi:hypothetical protein
MEKTFKRIPSFPNYLVSDTGTVINIKTGTIRKTKLNPYGYAVVGMWENKKRVIKLVHRLVCEAFYGYSDWPIVNHINGIRSDNRVENLEWCSVSHNNTDCYRVLKRPLPKHLLNGYERSKPCLVIKGEKTGLFKSVKEAAKANGVPHHLFNRMLKGKNTKISHLYIIQYPE